MSSFLQCLIRNKPVAATPEECVRQSVIHHMITKLAFPKSLITLEKELAELIPKDKGKIKLKRRLDIVAFAKSGTGLSPLLIIECKAKAFDQKALSQVLGYNMFLLAPFFALVSAQKTAFFAKNEQNAILASTDIPSYAELTKLNF